MKDSKSGLRVSPMPKIPKGIPQSGVPKVPGAKSGVPKIKGNGK